MSDGILTTQQASWIVTTPVEPSAVDLSGEVIQPMDSFVPSIASPAPATTDSQQASWLNIVNSAVQGTLGIVQQVVRPSAVYPATTAGYRPGSSQGASTTVPTTAGSTFQNVALVGAGLALVVAGALYVSKRRRA